MVTRKRVAWLGGGGGAPSATATSTLTTTSGRIPASSAASSALSTASLTQVRSALRGLSKPSRWRFLVKNSETEISRWRAPISTAEGTAGGLASFGSAAGAAASGFALDLALDLGAGLDLSAALDFGVRFAIALNDTSTFGGTRSDHQGHDQQRHDIDDLDERIDRRAGRVLVGIADGVARDRGLVRVRSLAAVVAVLDVFLGVVPGSASCAHRDGDEQSRDDGTHEHAAERLRPKNEADDDRHQHRQERWDNHLLDRGEGEHVDRPAVLWLRGTFHDPRDFLELAADFHHHRAGGAP